MPTRLVSYSKLCFVIFSRRYRSVNNSGHDGQFGSNQWFVCDMESAGGCLSGALGLSRRGKRLLSADCAKVSDANPLFLYPLLLLIHRPPSYRRYSIIAAG